MEVVNNIKFKTKCTTCHSILIVDIDEIEFQHYPLKAKQKDGKYAFETPKHVTCIKCGNSVMVLNREIMD